MSGRSTRASSCRKNARANDQQASASSNPSSRLTADKAHAAPKKTKAKTATDTSNKMQSTRLDSNDTPQAAHASDNTQPAQPSPQSRELPHNLGTIPIISPQAQPLKIENEANKEDFPLSTGLAPGHRQDVTPGSAIPALETVIKRSTYKLTPGSTPYPELQHPTPQECQEVHDLLTQVHGKIIAPSVIPAPSLTVTGCGEVPSVLDALIRTLLSGATTFHNAAVAFAGLVERFGTLDKGIGKGSVNWDAVRQASQKDVFMAIKGGGLADGKSRNIKAILDMVYEDNLQRRKLLSTDDPNAFPDQALVSAEKAEKDQKYEIDCANENLMSLNHMHNLPTDEVMEKLTQYPGVGPKTAACVILFCLQPNGWAGSPPTCRSEISAFSHLEFRIPDQLKYALHQLLIRHGQECVRCKANTSPQTPGWEKECILERLVTRTKTRDAKRDRTAEEGEGGRREPFSAEEDGAEGVIHPRRCEEDSRGR
ncbi:HhH-GPD family base excision DNA repair protein [Penicillium chermesinum]|nr:HhH-GPD family base excision DNA repair protein [Penicillium chermesinum]